MMINVRRALHSDAQNIIDSHVRSIREICFKDYTPEQIEAWAGRKFKPELWWQTIDRDYVWVVEVNSQVRGFAHLAFMDKDTAEVLGLYLAPEAKGLGAGKTLFNILRSEAKSQGVKKLQLHATLTAKTFYETFGFIQTAGLDSVEMRGVDIPCVPMEAIL
ncbi:GNAT family N-acetyltransferase [Peredibacter sp. HCB2-198]|uniref:GNAT family N-acetyltransferase n=1 Tax=Peredibacter sp. HCB2-198 TaxID=3383025 RepID=UPI0038B5A5B1